MFRSQIFLHRHRVTYSTQSLIDVWECDASAILEARGVDAEKAVARRVSLLAELSQRRED